MIKKLYIINLNKISILEQLRLEEALLRTDQRNICLINRNCPPAIVMGVSAYPEELLHISKIQQEKIPVFKRFSGGGTVYIDGNTLFVTFIFQKESVNMPSCFPKDIMEWSAKLYTPLFEGLPFSLQENDYTLGEKKIGGNAQSILKERFLHHTSFLWNYDKERMGCLLLPKKQPRYRQNRSHEDFLTPLHPYFNSQEDFIEALKRRLYARYTCEELPLEEVRRALDLPHRRSTLQVSIADQFQVE
jgi:lipoate---protein ligase